MSVKNVKNVIAYRDAILEPSSRRQGRAWGAVAVRACGPGRGAALALRGRACRAVGDIRFAIARSRARFLLLSITKLNNSAHRRPSHPL